MTTPTTTVAPPTKRPDGRVELARYTVPADGERILYGQRTRTGEAIIIDVPAGSTGRVYLVERDVEQDGNAALQALLADYLQVGQAIQRSPMERTVP